MDLAEQGHSFGAECVVCWRQEGTHKAPPCTHVRYSPKRLAFRERHREAYEAIGDGSLSHELQRLEREFSTLPRGHLCTCSPTACAFWNPHGGACVECVRLHDERAHIKQDVAVSIGRTALVHAPLPGPVEAMDEAYAAKHGHRTARGMADFLNGDDPERSEPMPIPPDLLEST